MRLNTLAYYADFVIGLALMVVLAAGALFGNNLLLNLKWLIYGCLGFATWTCVEYVIHRWVYHHVPVFREVHNAHHAEPCAYIGAPPLVGLIVILAVLFAPVVSTSFNVASGLTTGVLSGYLGYMFVHHSAHYWTVSPTSWLYRIGRHHALHHYHSEACNFGITTSFWDHVFGTASRQRQRSKDNVALKN